MHYSKQMIPVDLYECFAGRVEATRSKDFEVAEEWMARSTSACRHLRHPTLRVRVLVR